MACRIEPHCNACGVCIAICPVNAVAELTSGITIHTLLCTECLGFAATPACITACPCAAITLAPFPLPSLRGATPNLNHLGNTP